jgi:hypothetical protein
MDTAMSMIASARKQLPLDAELGRLNIKSFFATTPNAIKS